MSLYQVSKMTYNMLMGTLNPTHLLAQSSGQKNLSAISFESNADDSVHQLQYSEAVNDNAFV